MNKTIDPKQLALADPDHPVKAPVNPQDTGAGISAPALSAKEAGALMNINRDKPTREQLLLATLPPHIDPASPAFKSDLAKIGRIAAAEAAREQLGMNEEDFNWNADDSVILKEQRATAVYFNKSQELVIRQKAAWDEEEDTFLFVTPENYNTFIDAVAARIRNG
jgi:hypothetical protein